MITRFLVCPFDEDLMSILGSRSLVPRLTSLDDIPRAVEAVGRSGAHLHCLLVKTQAPLTALTFKEEWMDIPIALYVSSLGRFPQFVKQLPLLRQLNLRVYLPTDSKENYSSVRIISSLGIETAVIFREEGLDWKLISDLMSYAYFARAPHAPIAPFDYMAARYHRHQRNDFSSVYFDDPRTYLHLDEKGQVALTSADLLAGKYIAQSIDDLGDIDQNDDYVNHLESWRVFFLQKDGCAYCPGWRVCLGKFSHITNGDTGCKQFFSELMDSVELKQSIKNNSSKQIWQP